MAEPTPLPFTMAMERAIDICLAQGIPTSKSYLQTLIKMRNASETGLRFFYSVRVKTGRGTGFMVVDMGDFEERLTKAMEMYPRKGRGNTPRVTSENLIPPERGI